MTRPRQSRGSLAAKGLTPLLDCLFLMLIALLALSESKSERRAELVHVDLPAVEPTEARASASDPSLLVRLTLGADSRLRLGADGALLATRAQLDEALASALPDALPEEVVVELIADRDARHGVAVELLEHLRTRGFARVRLLAVGTRDAGDPFGASHDEEAR